MAGGIAGLPPGSTRRPVRRVPILIAAGLLLLAVLFIVFYPISIIVFRAIIPFNSQLWVTTLTAPALGVAVRNTMIIALCTTTISVPFGVFFAWLIERTDARWGALSRSCP